MRRALASGAALRPLLGRDDAALARAGASATDAADPRARLAARAGAALARRAGEKTLVFVAHRETLELLRDGAQPPRAARDRRLPRGAVARAARHRGRAVPPARRARACSSRPSAAARAATSSSAAASCCSTCRGARSWSSSASAGSIASAAASRSRSSTSVPPEGIGADVVRLFEALGLFREPLAGLEPELARVEAALEMAALVARGHALRRRASTRSSPAPAPRSRGSARRPSASCTATPTAPELAAAILARVPPDLDALNEEVVTSRLRAAAAPRRAARAATSSRSSSATTRSSTACPASRAGRASSARSTARRPSPTRRLDFFASGPPARRGRARPPRGVAARARGRAARGDRRREGARACSPSTRTGRCSRPSPWTPPVAPAPTGPRALRRRPLRTRRVPAGAAARARLAGRDPPDRGGARPGAAAGGPRGGPRRP